MEQFICAEPKDKIYGVLSLIDWGDKVAPVPNYAKDAFQLAVEVL
jgi:hypothetical protein